MSPHRDRHRRDAPGDAPFRTRLELRPRGLDGITEEQIAQHWTLYEGYVASANALSRRLAVLSRKKDFGSEFSELKRRLNYETNGVVLHELYFAGLRARQDPPGDNSDLGRELRRCFGGFSEWRDEFCAMGKMRGVGWVVLYWDPVGRALVNHWIGMHEEGHPAGFLPILALDLWEHAYMVDHAANGRAVYVELYLKNLNWPLAESRLAAAVRWSEAVSPVPAGNGAHAR